MERNQTPASDPGPAPGSAEPADSPASRTGLRGNYLVNAAALVIVVAGIREAQAIVVPLLIAVLLAMVFAPVLFFLERRGAPAPVALAVVLVGMVAILSLLGVLLATSVNEFTEAAPRYEQRLRDLAASTIQSLQDAGVTVPEANRLLDIADPGAVLSLAGRFFSGLGNALANSFLILLLVVFILMEASGFPAKLHTAFGQSETRLGRLRELAFSVNRYLGIKTWMSLATGAAIASWLSILGVDFALLWGILAFLLNYIPNIGSVLAGIPPTLLALVQHGWGSAALVLLGVVVVNNVIGNVVEPRLTGRELGLSTLTVFLSLVFWGWVLGPVGMLLSIPLTMTVKIAMEARQETRWLAILLGSPKDAREVERKRAAEETEETPETPVTGPPPAAK